VRNVKGFVFLGVVMLWLTGCVMPPGGYGYTQTTVGFGGPRMEFSFSDGVGAYYAPTFGTYIYSDNGYYYRWTGGGWIYTTYYDGPWMPVEAGVYLPPLLIYGPPPPIVGYRPYFNWWRIHQAGWYAANHPRWWYRHRFYIHHYALWQDHVVRFYANHPGQRPVMRALFHAERGQGGPPERRAMRRGEPPHYLAPRPLLYSGPGADRGPARYERPGPGPGPRLAEPPRRRRDAGPDHRPRRRDEQRFRRDHPYDHQEEGPHRRDFGRP